MKLTEAEKSAEKEKKNIAKKAAAKRTKKDEKKSFNKVLGYAKKEIGAFSIGMVYLWLACVSDFVVPLYIGFVIDVLEKGEYQKVGALCWQLFIIIIVSVVLLFKTSGVGWVWWSASHSV